MSHEADTTLTWLVLNLAAHLPAFLVVVVGTSALFALLAIAERAHRRVRALIRLKRWQAARDDVRRVERIDSLMRIGFKGADRRGWIPEDVQ